jgi:glycosyltransferase involved in cell wall biosynthesis
MTRVSICIPTYRQVEFLQQTLRSILTQDYADYEVVVTDDSPDDCVETLVRSMDFGARMRFFRNPTRLGAPENWNEAVRRANGDYIKIMHHDDYFVSSGSLGAFVRLLDEQPAADFGFSATRVENVSTGRTRKHCIQEDQLKRIIELPDLLFTGNFIGAPSATIYRRSVALEYDRAMQWLVDVDFYVRVLRQNPTIAFSPEMLIATTDGAGHQITRYFSGPNTAELVEYTRLFAKLSVKAISCSEIAEAWDRLFERYEIQFYSDFAGYGVTPNPAQAQYFENLLWRRRRASERALKAELLSQRDRITALESEIASIKAELAGVKAELARGNIATLKLRFRRFLAYLAKHRGMDILRIGRISNSKNG